MINRKELIASKEYWIADIQIALYTQVTSFLNETGLTQTQLAQRLGVSKGYISQIMKGDFDHRISKLVEISLAIGLVPKIEFQKIEEHCGIEKQDDLRPYPSQVDEFCLRIDAGPQFASRKKARRTKASQSSGKFPFSSSSSSSFTDKRKNIQQKYY